MKNSSVIAIQSCVITTIVYALLTPIFFEMDNAFGEREYFVDNNNNNKDQKMYNNQQVVDTKCKSPCPSTAEMCIAMCA
jgi:hypothetical protein